MRKILFLFLAILLLTASVVFADDLADVRQSGVLRMGVPQEYIPFVFEDESGKPTGIDIALMEEICRRMGVRLQVISLAFDGMIDALNLEQVDVIGGAFSKTQDRMEKIDFTRVYYKGEAQFIGLNTLSKPQTISMESFRDLKIGSQKGTSFDQWIKTNLVGGGYVSPRNVYTYATAADEMKALDRKDVDLVLMDQDVYEKMYRSSGKYQIFYNGFVQETYAFGLRKGSTLTAVVNEHLTNLLKDKTGDEIAGRFFRMNFDTANVDTSRSSQIIIPVQVAAPVIAPVTAPVTAPTAAPAVQSCINGMVYVSDVTIPDGHQVKPGENFRKVWRVLNNGTCTWTPNYSFVFVSGDQMSGRAVSIPANVAPGQTVDLAVDMIGPNSAGTYKGNWQMRSPQGKGFGQTIWVKVRVNGSPVASNTNPYKPSYPTAVPQSDGQKYTPVEIYYFYPDYYAGEEDSCVNVYWSTSNASMVEITVDGESMYRGDWANGTKQLCGPITNRGAHNVQLYAFNVTADTYSAFTYTTNYTEDRGGYAGINYEENESQADNDNYGYEENNDYYEENNDYYEDDGDYGSQDDYIDYEGDDDSWD